MNSLYTMSRSVHVKGNLQQLKIKSSFFLLVIGCNVINKTRDNDKGTKTVYWRGPLTTARSNLMLIRDLLLVFFHSLATRLQWVVRFASNLHAMDSGYLIPTTITFPKPLVGTM